jgi:hypothetical protein
MSPAAAAALRDILSKESRCMQYVLMLMFVLISSAEI